MACGDCTEFLTQGSGIVGSGSALAWEKVINFFDSDNIPLTVRSAEVLTKNGSPLVDTTPPWFGFETAVQSLLIDGVITYRLTVTVQIDAVVAGEGTYNIRVCARVVDDSKALVCCSFNVCITAAQAGLVIGDIYIGADTFPSNRQLWNAVIPDLGSPATNPMTLVGNWSSGSCGFDTFEYPQPRHFHPTERLILGITGNIWTISSDDFIACPIEIGTVALGLPYAQFDWIRDLIYYMSSDAKKIRKIKKDGTGDAILVDFTSIIGASALGAMVAYDEITDLLYVRFQGPPDVYQIDLATETIVGIVASGLTANPSATEITIDTEHQEILEPVPDGIKRWPIDGSSATSIIGLGTVFSIRWHVDHQRYYWFNNSDEIKRCDYMGGNIEVAAKKPGSGLSTSMILAGFEEGS